MDANELFRLMTIIRSHMNSGKHQVGRTKEQIADINDRAVQSVWEVLTNRPIETVELRADDKEAVVGCTTVELGEKTTLPDNRIGPCQWGCGRIIQWRPYLPDHTTKACLYCVVERLEQGHDL